MCGRLCFRRVRVWVVEHVRLSPHLAFGCGSGAFEYAPRLVGGAPPVVEPVPALFGSVGLFAVEKASIAFWSGSGAFVSASCAIGPVFASIGAVPRAREGFGFLTFYFPLQRIGYLLY